MNKNIYIEKNEIQKKNEKQAKYDNAKRRNRGLVITISFLMIISLINIYSASYYNIGMKNSNLIKHGLYIFLAIVFFISSLKFNYKKLDNLLIIRGIFLIINIVFIIMLVLSNVAPSIVPRVNGAIGWIRIPGVGSIQPAEIFKTLFIIMMAYRLALSEKNKDQNLSVVLKNILIPLIFTGYLLLQHDLGTLIHYYSIWFFMLFMSKIKGKYIAWLSGIGGLAGVAMLAYIYLGNLASGGYKLQRIKSFLTGLITNYYDEDKGYQVRQSLIGIGSGGVLGKGYGNGIQKYSYLPEIHTDFIFASYSEEFGFVGVIVIIMLITIIFYLIRGTAIECEDYFGKYLAIGIGGAIMLQFIINISVAIGLLPVFGIPMPFMSFGGSSIVSLFIALGMIFSINKEIVKELKEEIEDTKIAIK